MPAPSASDRLSAVRKKMRQAKVDAMMVRSTDRYLNEYVPNDESARVWLSGFTGSMGDMLVTKDRAYLAVDGRYWTQAEQEVDKEHFEVVKVPLGTSISTSISDLIRNLSDAAPRKKLTVGYEPTKTTPADLEHVVRTVGNGTDFKPLFPSPVEAARGVVPKAPGKIRIRAVDEARLGATVQEKLTALAPKLVELDVDALLVQKLDEIAYLSNLRGNELPYQATFKAIALVTPTTLFVGLDPSTVPSDVRMRRESVLFVPEAELWTLIGKKTHRPRVGYDRSNNTEWARISIEATGATATLVESPIGPMKAKKNKAEMTAMAKAFARADGVVSEAAKWLCSEVVAGNKVTEADFSDRVNALFTGSGATGLSFKVISAAGKNGAIIHYSTPSPRRRIKRGELMLLDTGAYYDEGYATDLTRTFLVDGPDGAASDEQRYYYTVVLKSAIAGMTAVLPVGAKGYQLDAITRAPLWAEGLDFNHGTGHGVGVNVHEFPPRIGPNATAVLEEGFVFSIEPGIYLPKFGGVRIENLCTLEKLPGKKGFMRVVPLTFSPLDARLIDTVRLSTEEKAFLKAFDAAHVAAAKANKRRRK